MKLRSCMTRCCVNRCDCNPRQSRMQFSARLTVTRRAGVFHLGHLPRRIRRYTGHTRISTDNIMRNMPAAMRFMLTLTFCFPAILHACMARTSTPNHRHTETHQLMLVWDRDAPRLAGRVRNAWQFLLLHSSLLSSALPIRRAARGLRSRRRLRLRTNAGGSAWNLRRYVARRMRFNTSRQSHVVSV